MAITINLENYAFFIIFNFSKKQLNLEFVISVKNALQESDNFRNDRKKIVEKCCYIE